MVKHLKIGNMTKQDKELLLKDLCCRLPYGVKIETKEGIQVFDIKWLAINMANIKSPYLPYLRPMSSMTKKEEREYSKYAHFGNTLGDWTKSIDYLYAHYIDFRGWIKKGLALPATDGMYNF